MAITKKIYGLFACISFHAILLAQPTCVELKSYKDAALGYHDNYGTSKNNYGTAPQNAAFTLPGAIGGVNSNRALLEFDLTGIPAGAAIISARLNLYAIGNLGALTGHSGTSNSAYLQRVISPWSEMVVTWDNEPPADTTHQVTLPASSSPLQDYLNIDVLKLINDMRSMGNNGFLLRLVNEITSNALAFCSTDHSDTTKYPTLEVCYTISTSVEEITPTENIDFYPNPASGLINVHAELGPGNNRTVEVYSVSGKLVSTFQVNSTLKSIDLRELPAGVYFAKMGLNNTTVTKKIILAH